ncbi:MAG: geranylgeranylglyceryl/heptaprenylglyceryl phosphate synthase [Flavobacteriaceae bacterium]|nr:geranylgeranylglyceryl/heptaprenylglyceryl phosphate synthase [Flavobacteriaceae bacterium]
MAFLKRIKRAKNTGQKLLAILLDPDKVQLNNLKVTVLKIENLKANFIFVGGSFVKNGATEILVDRLKQLTQIKIILFPGDVSQITNRADTLLFMSLLSGLNPEYLVTQQIKSVAKLKDMDLEVVPTAYILVDGGTVSSVQNQSKTKPLLQNDTQKIVDTAIAGTLMGKQLIYLEAGSGAKYPVKAKIINKVAQNVRIPLIVGGGIRTQKQLDLAYASGADLVVIGTAFEENNLLLKSDKK